MNLVSNWRTSVLTFSKTGKFINHRRQRNFRVRNLEAHCVRFRQPGNAWRPGISQGESHARLELRYTRSTSRQKSPDPIKVLNVTCFCSLTGQIARDGRTDMAHQVPREFLVHNRDQNVSIFHLKTPLLNTRCE